MASLLKCKPNILKISHSIIRTNNYKLLYETISKINQGLTPYEVKKYESVIKDIVVSAGKEGKLDQYLVTPKNIDDIPKQWKNRKIVVALGDRKNIFVHPNLIDYINDYYLDDTKFLPEVALPLIVNENSQARLPFVKHLKNLDIDNLDFLSNKQKKKIHKRNENMGSLNSIIATVPKNNKRSFSSLSEILRLETTETSKIEIIWFNLKSLDKKELFNYIKSYTLKTFPDNYEKVVPELSAQRRLLLGYDLLINGDL